MIWFFERAQNITRLKTTFDNDRNEYILVIEGDAGPRTERFSTLQAFAARLLRLEERLRAENWVQRADVEFLDEGWRVRAIPPD
jgi:hypothetical protein